MKTAISNDPLDEMVRKLRLEKFEVKVAPTRRPVFEGEETLSITLNGSDWWSVSLSPAEKAKLIAALTHPAKGK